ncbi:MAG TPA: AAA family ATPase, partial [Kofleriaceae bacterium]|nr:AAA family ATPase [Kofleriaceae bacterium]
PASDWYSLGVILYRILTGRMPFLGGRDDVLMDKQRFEPPAPREVAMNVPGDLDALCSELLRRAPEARPAAAEILRRLGSAPERGTGLSSRSFVSSQAAYDQLIGRGEEIGRLNAAYERAKAGQPVLVRLFGPSGVGKSRTTRAFIEGLPAEDDAMVLRGRCYEQESVPFKAVDSVVDALAGHLARMTELEVEGLMPRDSSALARLFPTLRQVDAFTSRRRRELPNASDPIELRRRGFAALRELLARIADRRPLVLVIDDLQWGDVDSVTLLATLLHPPDAPAVMLVTGFRSEGRESNPFLVSFDEQIEAGDIAATDIEIGPLSAEDAHRLAALHLGGGADALAQVERIVVEAHGNPFLVEELARHVRERTDQDAVSLDQVLRTRLLRLPREAAHLLSIIAVAGRPLTQAIALRAANVTDPAVLAQLKVGSFVRTRSVGELRLVEPYHDQVRTAAVALLSDDDRREIHQRLAEIHEALPSPDPEMLAYHYAQAGDVARAAELSVQAARRAGDALAFDRAAFLYRNAIAMTTGPVDRRLHVALGDALANGGRGRESADAYIAALDGAPAAEALELKCRAASQLLLGGHIDRGLATLGEVIESVGLPSPTKGKSLVQIAVARLQLFLRGLDYREVDEREVPASQLVRLDVAFAAAEGLGTADPMRAAAFQAKSLLMALRTGEPKRVARALATEVVFVSLPGIAAQKRTAEIQAKLDKLAMRLGDPASLGLAEGARGLSAFNEGRWADCEASCQRAEQIFRDQCTGLRWELATAQLFRGFALAMTGRVRELVSGFPVIFKDAQERGDLFAATSMRACLGFYAPLTRHEPARAYREVDLAIANWSVAGFHVQHANALNSRVSIDLYRGDGITALRRCAETWPALEKSLLLRVQLLRALLTSVRARAMITAVCQDGDKSRLRHVLGYARRLERERVGYCTAEATMLRAAVAHLSGDTTTAVTLLERADVESKQANLVLNNVAVRRARGVLIGGSEGAALIEESDAYCRGEGIQCPERVTAVFAPGFDASLTTLDVH